MHLHDSGKESRLQLVFVPGAFSPEAWKYQLNYFSKDRRTISFRPTVSNRSFSGHREALKEVLDQEEVDNAVLVGSSFSASLVQGFEVREDVAATVLVGARKKLKKDIPGNVYRVFTSDRFPPKLCKKMFFPSVRYREVRDFCREVDFLEPGDFKSFQERFGVREPEKECLIVHGEKDFFSDRDYVRKLRSHASVTVVETGSFSFYEKPQEFNKTLNDFLLKIERKKAREEIEKTQEQNRTLEEFEKRMAKVRK